MTSFNEQRNTDSFVDPAEEGVPGGEPQGVGLTGGTEEGESLALPDPALHQLPPALLALTLLVHLHVLA